MSTVTERRSKPISVVLVDHQPLIRKLLREQLERGGKYAVIAEATDGEEAMRKVGECQPEVILLDVEMPGMNGVVAASIIHSLWAEARIVLTSMFDETEYRRIAHQVGALGFLPKASISPEELDLILELTEDQAPSFGEL